jgi:hypothetical protein
MRSDRSDAATLRSTGGRAAGKRDRVRLSARNSEHNGTTGTLHFLRVCHPVKSGMAKRKKAADQAAVECLVRVVTKDDGRQVLEIEIPDGNAALKIASALVRGARE